MLIEFIRSVLQEMSSEDIEDLLQALATVFRSFRVEEYGGGEILCNEGVEEDTFYIIVRGEVAIYKQITPGAEKDLLAKKGPGEFFGEMALILDAPRSADVITTQTSTMLELDRRSFDRATKISPELSRLMSSKTINLLDKNWHAENSALATPRRYQVFTSYARANEAFVTRCVQELQSELHDNHIELWMDQIHIHLGDPWDEAIEAALEQSDAMLLFISENSMQSKNVRDEWSHYLDDEKPIIPVVTEKCKLPTRLRRLQYVDFSRLEYNTALARVHAALLDLASQSLRA